MELPIDHFRLLGVSPATDAQNVLRALEQRLERVPDQGFTQESLQARAELLRQSADVLSDQARRQAYEADLMALEAEGGEVAAGLDVPPSKEVGGLLLLLEAGQALEAFEAARRSLQPPQAPALGSSREADLSLLAGLACETAAADLRRERRFEASAGLLQEGMQLLQRMGKAPELRRRLEAELNALLPFRVLDLLSRDLGAVAERSEGLQLLETLVQRRGGLEGADDPAFPQDEFQAFIKQIRQFLTVQEQVDLFGQWATFGSPAAVFLASYALTASGFAQRKPERVVAARQRLQLSGQPGLEPILACLHLLLGQIDPAVSAFQNGAGEELKQWAREQQGDDSLAQLCAYCRDWLAREVLPGYRDIEVDADLEAYFADRDVQAYVEQQDRRQSRGVTPAGSGADPADWESIWSQAGQAGQPAAGSWALPGPPAFDPVADEPETLPAVSRPRRRSLPTLSWPALSWAALPPWGPPALLALLAALGLGGAGWLLLRPRQATPPQSAPTSQPLPAPGASKAAAPVRAIPLPAIPLTAVAPDQAQIQSLLQAWLTEKASLLATGKTQLDLGDLALPPLVRSLRAEARQLAARGQKEQVKATVKELDLRQRGPQRIVADVRLDYSEELRSTGGDLIRRTGPRELRNVYIFSRDGQSWKLAKFYPSP